MTTLVDRLFAALTGIALLECPHGCGFRARCGRQLDLHVEGDHSGDRASEVAA